jgi:hypothetical protein
MREEEKVYDDTQASKYISKYHRLIEIKKNNNGRQMNVPNNDLPLIQKSIVAQSNVNKPIKKLVKIDYQLKPKPLSLDKVLNQKKFNYKG